MKPITQKDIPVTQKEAPITDLSLAKVIGFVREFSTYHSPVTRVQLSTKKQGFQKKSVYGKNIFIFNRPIVTAFQAQTMTMMKQRTTQPTPKSFCKLLENKDTTQMLKGSLERTEINKTFFKQTRSGFVPQTRVFPVRLKRNRRFETPFTPHNVELYKVAFGELLHNEHYATYGFTDRFQKRTGV